MERFIRNSPMVAWVMKAVKEPMSSASLPKQLLSPDSLFFLYFLRMVNPRYMTKMHHPSKKIKKRYPKSNAIPNIPGNI